MIHFNLIWPNTNLKFHIGENNKEDFCEEFFSSMQPKDIWPLLECGIWEVEDKDACGRLLTFLRKRFSDFTFSNPESITVRITCP